MSNEITLPPIIITPDYPLPKPPVLPPTYIGKPLPWDGKIIALTNLDNFFSQKDIRSDRYTMTVVVTIASAHRSVEQSYLTYLPRLRSDIESEIATAVGTSSTSPLEKSTLEKAIIDSIIKQSGAELIKDKAIANAFFGRDLLARDMKNGAVDFVNIFQNPRNPNTPLSTYKKWSESITAAYRAKVLSEKIRILTEKSKALISTIATAQAEEDARLAAEAESIRIANTFRAQGSLAAAQPLFIVSSGVITVAEATATLLAAAIRSAIVGLTSVIAGSASAVAVGVFSLLAFPSKLANGELPERYTFSTPLSDLVPNHSLQELQAAAAAGGSIDMPVRFSSKTAVDGQSEVFVVKTDGVAVPSKVRVIAAAYNAGQNIYTATTADVPPRTLTWTPIVSPGNSSTTSPTEEPVTPAYTGATITPVEGRIDTFPAVAEASFDDYIIVYPVGSGFVPVYVMFRDRREDAGVATGTGQPVSGIWLGAASQGDGAPIPSQIADQLRGQKFKNFREFREIFWSAVASDTTLAGQFKTVNLSRMKKGYAPYAIPSEQVGGKVKFELHHVIFLKNNGALYDIDNIRVVTPKQHTALHK
ncbi:S-type pyocin domain-containing protein [Pseudomonas mediterranea]|uniref:S-type pyocin domain-containing protein n=1 Tax=Pseudomonas mediterranea TaxID=183795 RepID=UPI002234A923|nr:S-type pyocin domain-containing protein [Pseudomonas mediterranea]UZE00845.1 S-type pyocin domain-containing protein [Pseudomonas mediterranea]